MDFKYTWIMMLICCYYKIGIKDVMRKHPGGKICEIKHIAQYTLWRAGAKFREAGELTGTKTSGTGQNIHYVIERMEYDKRFKGEIMNISKLIG